MEQTHTLAVVSRAKAIARDAGQAPKDEVLAYLCACADVSGVWQALLQGDDVDAAAQPGSEPAGLQSQPAGERPPSAGERASSLAASSNHSASAVLDVEPRPSSAQRADAPAATAASASPGSSGTEDRALGAAVEGADAQAAEDAATLSQADDGDVACDAVATMVSDGAGEGGGAALERFSGADGAPARGDAGAIAAAAGHGDAEGAPASQIASDVASGVDRMQLVKAIEALAQHVVAQAAEPHSAAVALGAIQLRMEAAFHTEQAKIAAECDERAARVDAKTRRVLQPRKAAQQSVRELTRLYDQVVYLVCMAGCMEGALEDAAAEQEVRAALESVFPFSMLAQFLTLPKADRELQLRELPYIALGICLYKQATSASAGRAVSGALLHAAGDRPAPQAQCRAQVDALTATLRDYSGALAQLAADPEAQPGSTFERTQTEALTLLQLRTSYEQLIIAAAATAQALGRVQAAASEVLSTADDLVQKMAAVPKHEILPLFHKAGQLFEMLSATLQELLKEQRNAQVHGALLDTLGALSAEATKAFAPVVGKHAQLVLHAPALIAGAHAAPQTVGISSDECEIIPSARSGGEAAAAALALGGVDPVLFVRHSGMPCAASSDVGRARVPADGGLLFGFACQATLDAFQERPAEFAAAARAALIRWPHLIPALGFMDPTLPRFVADVAALRYDAIKCSAGTQTPVHFVERHIDHRYQWNEWELRRQTLRLADLETKATHSAQTVASAFRRDGETQLWTPRAATSQTMVSKGQNMAKLMRYVAGLRGAPDKAKMRVINLELDMGQPHGF